MASMAVILREFFVEPGSCPDTLDLSSHNLTGTIPTEIGKLTRLTSLNLSGNRLCGPIPASLGKLKLLTTLNLKSNQLCGSIPPELGDLKNLAVLNLDNNKLTGELPYELASLCGLRILCLNDNQLEGEIPRLFSQLKQLKLIQLSDNFFIGGLPTLQGTVSAVNCFNRTVPATSRVEKILGLPIGMADILQQAHGLTKAQLITEIEHGRIPIGFPRQQVWVGKPERLRRVGSISKQEEQLSTDIDRLEQEIAERQALIEQHRSKLLEIQELRPEVEENVFVEELLRPAILLEELEEEIKELVEVQFETPCELAALDDETEDLKLSTLLNVLALGQMGLDSPRCHPESLKKQEETIEQLNGVDGAVFLCQSLDYTQFSFGVGKDLEYIKHMLLNKALPAYHECCVCQADTPSNLADLLHERGLPCPPLTVQSELNGRRMIMMNQSSLQQYLDLSPGAAQEMFVGLVRPLLKIHQEALDNN